MEENGRLLAGVAVITDKQRLGDHCTHFDLID
jgi:hypothetical protein